MITNKTIEGNNLIAEFMGYVNTTPDDPDFNIYENNEGKMIESMSMQFHSSWDWLMPVVRKIVEYCINENEEAFMSEQYTSILDVVPLAIIEDTWKVVVEFIQYYNENVRQ